MENENTLLDFSWDDDSNIGAIFGEDSVEEQPQDVEDTDEVNDEVNNEVNNEEDDKEEEYEEQLVKEKNTRVKSDVEDSPKNNNQETTIYDDVYKDLKDYGVLKHVSIEDGESIDAERLAELYEEDYEEEIKTRINNWASKELDEDAQAFIKFKRAGGKTSEFLDLFRNNPKISYLDGDIEDEDFQDEVIRHQLREDDWDDDEIEDRLETLTNNGKKSSVAKKYYSRIENQIKKERDNLVMQQEEHKKQAIIQEQSFKEGIKEVLSSNKEIQGFKINNKEKTQLLSFLTERNVRIDEERSITGFQKKLAEVFQDTDKLVLLAKLINNDFDMSDFKKSVITQETKKIKSNLENRKGLTNTSFGSSTSSVNLSSIFS